MSLQRCLDGRQQAVGTHRLVHQRQARVGHPPQIGGGDVAGNDDRRYRLADVRPNLLHGGQAVLTLAQSVVAQDQVGVAQVLLQPFQTFSG